MKLQKTIIITTLLSSLLSATLYSDGEEGTTEGWSVYDNIPTGAEVLNVFDQEKNSNVIEFKGAGRLNSYFIGARKGEGAWNNSTEKILQWNMKFSEKFKISVYLDTEEGERVILYNYRNSDIGRYFNKYMLLGLGEQNINGEWVNISRDLEADLHKYDANNTILNVNGFKLQGSGKIDDLKLVHQTMNMNQVPPMNMNQVPFMNMNQVPPMMDNTDQLLRGPYLQQGSSRSIIVKWRTAKASNSKVRYGTDANNLMFIANNSEISREHEVKLTNLNPSSRYYYKIGNNEGEFSTTAKTFFKTAPLVGSNRPLRIWVLGDSGSMNQPSKEVYTAYQNLTGTKDTDFILMLGDNAYKNGTDSEYQSAVFDKYSALLAQTSLWSVYGNHDALSPNIYFNAFTFPTKGELGGVASSSENYYSYNYGNMHFIVLDSSASSLSTNSPMMEWLKSDLAQNSAKWLVASWHHAPYTKGSYDSDKTRRLTLTRENFLPILEEYGVDLVFSGHSHVYERSKFINGHYGESSTFNTTHIVQNGDGRVNGDGAYLKNSKRGTVYVVLGSSGTPKEGVPMGHPIMASESAGTTGSVILEVNDNILDVQYLTEKGEVLDSFRIQK